jgi:hypothetical protein
MSFTALVTSLGSRRGNQRIAQKTPVETILVNALYLVNLHERASPKLLDKDRVIWHSLKERFTGIEGYYAKVIVCDYRRRLFVSAAFRQRGLCGAIPVRR